MKALITGIGGSGGSYLAEQLQKRHEVHGITRWHSNKNSRLKNVNACLHECDLNDFSSIQRVLKEVEPDVVYHLASYANVRTSFDTPLLVLQNNIMGTANLFEAIRGEGKDTLVQLCSSAQVYGDVTGKSKETTPLKGNNPYSISKVTQDMLGEMYGNLGMKVIRSRAFGYINPRREDLFATSWAKQIAEIERGERKVLLHGNLDAVRTMIDIRDAMVAYEMLNDCTPGEAYNIGSEEPVRVGDYLEVLKSKANCEIPCREDPNLLRPLGIHVEIPDTTKFRRETGWQPSYDIDESTEYLLETFRK